MQDSVGATNYEYDKSGKITNVTIQDGKKILYKYDELGRLQELIYPDKKTVKYEYDLLDRMTAVIDREGKTTIYEYDEKDRLVKTTRPNGTITVNTYDDLDNLINLTNKDNTGKTISNFNYTYNAKQEIEKEISIQDTTTITRNFTYSKTSELLGYIESNGTDTKIIAYTYDNVGNKITKEENLNNQTIIKTNYSYNDLDQLTQEKTNDKATEYNYDINGNLIKKAEQNGTITTYEYDIESRLKAVKDGNTILMSAIYDGNGDRIFSVNRKMETYAIRREAKTIKNNTETSTNEDNILETEEVIEPKESTEELPNAGNKEDEKIEKDIKESLFWYGFFQGTLNIFAGFNQAVQVYLSNWLDKNWTAIVNAYENRNVIILDDKNDDKKISIVEIQEANKNENIDETSKIQKEDLVYIPLKIKYEDRENYELTQYINDITYANTQVLMEYGRKDKINTAYSYGNERVTYEETNKTNYYLYDGRGSVANITGQDGNSMVNYNYDAYGSSTLSGKTNNKYGYNAEYTEPVTGMQYLRARYYEPTTGNFTTQDSYLGTLISPVTQNRYAYAGNNPVNNIDPSGHSFLSNIGNAIKNTVTTAITNIIKKPTVSNIVSNIATVASKAIKGIASIFNEKKIVSDPNVALQNEIEKLQGIDDQIKSLMSKAYFVGSIKERASILNKIAELTALRKKVCESKEKIRLQLIPEGYLEYQVDKALKYASNNFNAEGTSKYPYFDGRDCANFVSQCLEAGGIIRTENWDIPQRWPFDILGKSKYDPTASWSTVTGQMDYFKDSKYTKEIYEVRSVDEMKQILTKIKEGDIAYISTEYEDMVTHAIIITGVTDDDLLYSGHTSPRDMKSITEKYFNNIEAIQENATDTNNIRPLLIIYSLNKYIKK